MNEEYLSHHGILGQKWGQKNGPPYPLGSDKSTGSRLKSSLKGAYGEHKKKKGLKKARKEKDKQKKEEKRLKELDRKIQRENKKAELLEAKKKVRSLQAEDKKYQEDKKRGQAIVRNILKESGQTALKTVATGAMIYAGKAAVSKIFDRMIDDNTRRAVKTFYPEKKK